MGKRVAWSVLLAGLGFVLLGYGVLRYQVGTRNLDFARKHGLTRLFPQPWLWEGHRFFYDLLDSQKACESYRQAVTRLQIFPEAWFALMKAEMARGNREAAENLFGALSPKLSRVSTWKWQELLMAFELKKDEAFASIFNFILQRMPQKMPDACFLAFRYWGSWTAVADHVHPANEPVLLEQLMASRELNAALALWNRMAQNDRLPEKKLTWRLCEGLLGGKRVQEAKEVWRRHLGGEAPWVYNGSFEEEPSHMAFDWRIRKHSDVILERTLTDSRHGRYSLHVRFPGTSNVNFHHVSQIVPVNPGARYRLRFAQKARGLTTDQGIRLELSGYGCQGLSKASDPVSGTRPWTEETLEFEAPEGCEAVLVQLRRKESLKFDSKIQGDYWIDHVRMEP